MGQRGSGSPPLPRASFRETPGTVSDGAWPVPALNRASVLLGVGAHQDSSSCPRPGVSPGQEGIALFLRGVRWVQENLGKDRHWSTLAPWGPMGPCLPQSKPPVGSPAGQGAKSLTSPGTGSPLEAIAELDPCGSLPLKLLHVP